MNLDIIIRNTIDSYVQTNELPKRVKKGERVEDRTYSKLSEVEKNPPFLLG